MFVCLETAGIHITEGLQLHSASDVDHYVAAAAERTLISTMINDGTVPPVLPHYLVNPGVPPSY